MGGITEIQNAIEMAESVVDDPCWSAQLSESTVAELRAAVRWWRDRPAAAKMGLAKAVRLLDGVEVE